MLETGYMMLQIRLLIQALTKLLTGQTGEQMDSTLIEAEAVGKNLIHDASGKPLGRGETTLKHREPKAVRRSVAQNGKMTVISRAKPVLTALGAQLKTVPKRRGCIG